MSLKNKIVEMFVKRIEAPQWFIDEYGALEKIKNSVIKDSGFSGNKVEEVEKDVARVLVGEKEFTDEQMEKMTLGMDMIEHYKLYIWAKYRYEMIGSPFGKAENLTFNRENNFIEIAK